MLSLQESVQTHVLVEEDRRLFLEAAIVRIMKVRKQLKHSPLIQEVISSLSRSFSVSVSWQFFSANIIFPFPFPRLPMKFGERAFSYADPVAWNSLPVHVREEMDFYRFKTSQD